MLSPYRVLDLTDERGLLCGKILADLGADVIQIESPAGSPSRRVGPFYRGEIHVERSLYWWAYAANKRGVTLDVATTDGRALLTRLVEKADFLIESGAPGALAALGLRWDALSEINPALIMASITPSQLEAPLLLDQATSGREADQDPVQRSEFRLSRAEGVHPWPEPDIGTHTVEICTDILGMSREEIDALVAEEVLEVAGGG